MINYKLNQLWALAVVTGAVSGGYYTQPSTDFVERRLACIDDLAMLLAIKMMGYEDDAGWRVGVMNDMSIAYGDWFHTNVHASLLRYGYTYVTGFNANTSAGNTARTFVYNPARNVANPYEPEPVPAAGGGLAPAELATVLSDFAAVWLQNRHVEPVPLPAGGSARPNLAESFNHIVINGVDSFEPMEAL